MERTTGNFLSRMKNKIIKPGNKLMSDQIMRKTSRIIPNMELSSAE